MGAHDALAGERTEGAQGGVELATRHVAEHRGSERAEQLVSACDEREALRCRLNGLFAAGTSRGRDAHEAGGYCGIHLPADATFGEPEVRGERVYGDGVLSPAKHTEERVLREARAEQFAQLRIKLALGNARGSPGRLPEFDEVVARVVGGCHSPSIDAIS